MKVLLVRKAATLAAIAMATTASSTPQAMHGVTSGAANAGLLRTLLSSPQGHGPEKAAHETIEDSVSAGDAMLMFVSGMGVLALQLRRKQKALRTARLTLRTT